MGAVCRLAFAFGAVVAAASGATAANLTSAETIEVKITQKTADAEVARLWDRVGTWCGIAEWHPAVRSCTEGKEGDAVYRTLSLKDGGKIKEKLLASEPGTYRYAIVESPLPVKNYEARFAIVPDKTHADAVDVVWSASYDAADGKSDADARGAIDGVFKDGLASIKSKIAKMPRAEDAASAPAKP